MGLSVQQRKVKSSDGSREVCTSLLSGAVAEDWVAFDVQAGCLFPEYLFILFCFIRDMEKEVSFELQVIYIGMELKAGVSLPGCYGGIDWSFGYYDNPKVLSDTLVEASTQPFGRF